MVVVSFGLFFFVMTNVRAERTTVLVQQRQSKEERKKMGVPTACVYRSDLCLCAFYRTVNQKWKAIPFTKSGSCIIIENEKRVQNTRTKIKWAHFTLHYCHKCSFQVNKHHEYMPNSLSFAERMPESVCYTWPNAVFAMHTVLLLYSACINLV